jgi:hypothetical protein
MRLILGGTNGDYLRNLIEEASVIEDGVRITESVWCAFKWVASIINPRHTGASPSAKTS